MSGFVALTLIPRAAWETHYEQNLYNVVNKLRIFVFEHEKWVNRLVSVRMNLSSIWFYETFVLCVQLNEPELLRDNTIVTSIYLVF